MFFGEQLRISRLAKSGKKTPQSRGSRRIFCGYYFMFDVFSRNTQNMYKSKHRSMVVFLVEARLEFVLMILI